MYIVQIKKIACQFLSYSRWLDETWPAPDGTAVVLPPSTATHCIRQVFLLWWIFDELRRTNVPVNDLNVYRDWMNMRKSIGDIISYVRAACSTCCESRATSQLLSATWSSLLSVPRTDERASTLTLCTSRSSACSFLSCARRSRWPTCSHTIRLILQRLNQRYNSLIRWSTR